ncbi:MAG TPA: sigma 54-interacting transcriptional regulator [Kofleriaceae bacterium]|nr:sigma 54-interacting transcriptional regulator [Kofleriaceae bacterium]
MRITRVTNQMLRRGGVGAAYLRVLGGPDAGLEVALPPIGVVIGADPSVDVVLSDPAVSSRHCTVTPGGDGFEVRDLGSRNGTLLDGVALSQARVPVGAVLRVGTSLVQLMPAEDALELPPSERTAFGGLIGASLAMRRVYALLERAAQSAASILFLGESGTGKELAARAVHEHSPRAGGALVVFDCGAASETLIASDLFGHVRGAFTGAHADRVGAFAAADRGTLFLDEIGDLPLALQPKLLRMLEAGEVVPLGGRAPERHDVRVVAATHRDLYQEVAEGGFRGDLYYRLAVVEVHLPPLRQRREDIPELVRLFLQRAGSPIAEVGGRNLERLIGYHWPGNVRELRNVITRAVALAAPGARFDDLPILLRPAAGAEAEPSARADRPYHEAKDELIRRFDADYLADLMRRAGGNVSQAARAAGLERKYLYKLLERAGLRTREE